MPIQKFSIKFKINKLKVTTAQSSTCKDIACRATLLFKGCKSSRGRRMPAASVDKCDVASWSACDGEDLSVMGVSDACFAAGSQAASNFPACNTCSPSIGGMAANVCVACKQAVLTAFGACSNPTVVTAACEELAKAVATSEEALATSEAALTDHIAAAASSAAATTASLAVAAAAGAVMFL